MNRDHWFWKYAYDNKGVYIQAGIATLLVNFIQNIHLWLIQDRQQI